ncbi:MAG TPA: prepilin peptidase [Candidatus Saccharimonadales bacterium]|nr:prepilin peptidase [Candidatus Saccharimonadales bacterium]
MLIAAIIAILGLLVGSFINAVVWRLHRQSKVDHSTGSLRQDSGSTAGQESRKSKAKEVGLSITHGRSMCPQCRHQLAPQDLVPVLSWLALRGRCRYCRQAISPQYPLVELATAGLFALSYLTLYPIPYTLASWLNLALWLYFLTALIILAVYDARWMLLPDVVLLPAIAVAAAQLVLNLVLGQPTLATASSLLAAAAAGASFYAIAWLTKGKGMGGGDIKLVFLMGLLLGLASTAVALFVGFMTASLVGVGLIAAAKLKKQERPKYIAFGPFLIAGTIIAKLYGTGIVEWYLKGLY